MEILYDWRQRFLASLATAGDHSAYGSDPLARLLVVGLRLGPFQGGVAAFLLGLFYLFLAAPFGFLQTTAPGQLGSLEDWHSQVLLLVVAPAICYFYLWQPLALAQVSAIPNRNFWPVAVLLALLGLAHDLPEVYALSGKLWAAANPLMTALREALLIIASYMLAMIALRHLQASFPIGERNSIFSEDVSRQIEGYGLTAVFLWAIIGTRLSIEAIELPARSGSITPDFYLKVFLYFVAAAAILFLPLHRRLSPATLAKMVLIVAFPLTFLLILWALGIQPHFAF